MQLDKMRDMNDDELKTVEKTAAEQLFRLRFQKSLGNQEGLKKFRVLKMEIARSKTLLREREIAAAKASSTAGERSVVAAGSLLTGRKQNRTKA